MGNIEHSPERVTVWLNHEKRTYEASSVSPGPGWERVEYVPASQLAGAVEALREWLEADDDAERDFNDQTEARLDAAIATARSIVGGQSDAVASPRKLVGSDDE